MRLTNPVTVSKLVMDRVEPLSTIQSNNVSFQITLKTEDFAYDLYENPVFEIEFPSYINVNIENMPTISIDELVISSWEVVKRERKKCN